MLKNLAFLLLIFSIFILFTVAKSAPKKCEISYYDVAQPAKCFKYLNDNGRWKKKCQKAEPSAGYFMVTDKQHRTFAEKSMRLKDLEFSGRCHCVLTLYSKERFKGKSKNYTFDKSKSQHIYAKKIWNKKSKSFQVTCSFKKIR